MDKPIPKKIKLGKKKPRKTGYPGIMLIETHRRMNRKQNCKESYQLSRK
jgi:hypothetical protein